MFRVGVRSVIGVCSHLPSAALFLLARSYVVVVVVDTGLAFDSWDLDYYTSMFQRIKRNPTSVECFDLAQSNR